MYTVNTYSNFLNFYPPLPPFHWFFFSEACSDSSIHLHACFVFYFKIAIWFLHLFIKNQNISPMYCSREFSNARWWGRTIHTQKGRGDKTHKKKKRTRTRRVQYIEKYVSLVPCSRCLYTHLRITQYNCWLQKLTFDSRYPIHK